jgi:Zn-dependent protease with chaperone function
MERLAAPERAALLARFAAECRFERGVILAEAALLATLLLFGIDLEAALASPLEALFVVFIACGETVLGLAYFATQKKLRADAIPDGVRIGRYDRESLAAVIERVKTLLTPEDRRIPVFLTRDKSANAAAIQVGPAVIINPLNGVYLNRTMLHLLEPEGLAAIVGHEFAHATRYRQPWDRAMVLHQATAAAACLAVYRLLGFETTLGYFAVFLVSSGMSFVRGYVRARSSRVIEYLCDDFGAGVAGVVPAMAALYETAARVEAQSRLQLLAIEAKLSGVPLSTRKILEVYEEVLPFDTIDPDLVRQQLEQRIAERVGKGGVSLRGFLEYLREPDDRNQLEELRALATRMRVAFAMPTIAGRIAIRHDSPDEEVETLVSLVENHPESFLFHLPDEDTDSATHPAFRRRLVYLWRNREAIEAQFPRGDA